MNPKGKAAAKSPLSPRFRWLKFGEVMPSGWIRAQMERDLREGFAGHLDQLAAQAGTDIFATGRNAPGWPNAPGQAGQTGEEGRWGNGETEGNWRTGHILMAYMSGDAGSKRKADAYVTHILQSQDADGYIGIYSPELRYRPSREDGDMWTQACILRGLTAYYEFTGRADVLKAIERTVQLTMSKYGPGKMTVFGPPPAAGGHRLMYVDVLEQLHDLTGNATYHDFGLWLYSDFCAADASANASDATPPSLLDLQKPLGGHGPSTLEHLRIPVWAYFVTASQDFEEAYKNAFVKIKRHLLPGGAVGASKVEQIGGGIPDPTETYYEYCAMKELLATWSSGLQKTGDGELADLIERLVFNAAEGARSAGGKGITYCTRDNRYRIGGELYGRSKFSPAHADVALCCNPNATYFFPLYVRGMWMRTADDGLAAMLYGPSLVKTKVKGVEVQIEEKTDYPFSPMVSITMSPQRPVDFKLLLRNPAWSKETRVRCEGATVTREGDCFLVCKEWKKGDQVSLEFSEAIEGITAANGEVYLRKGPLVYALRIPEVARTLKDYRLPGFSDLEYYPPQGAHWSYALDQGKGKGDFGFIARSEKGADMLYPYDGAPVRLEGMLINLDSGRKEDVQMIPMGSSLAILRRVTFPVGQPEKK